ETETATWAMGTELPPPAITLDKGSFLTSPVDGDTIGPCSSDRWIGRVLDTIDRVGRRHDTIVIVMSDHGHLFGEHGRISKWGAWLELWDECAHQFFMVRHPDGPGSSRHVGGLIQPADLAPSILEMLGIKPPEEMGIQGHSWLPLIDGRKRSIRPAAISAFHPRQGFIDGCHNHVSPDDQWTAATITDRRWQLIDFPETERRELYDLSAEGGSLQNVISGNAAEVERLHGHLLDHLNRHDAPDWLRTVFRDEFDATVQPPPGEWRDNVRKRSTPRALTPKANIVG
ncbi:MAG: sulfatase-like hydrolase/transferase, partial [Chloroflexota bacterium]|nr:sulfatase-like hydrolase/transferase [Chloroflexota bacterium]